jgi:uncharacterized membrane protein AbrB (regulator of aidB expression)
LVWRESPAVATTASAKAAFVAAVSPLRFIVLWFTPFPWVLQPEEPEVSNPLRAE